MMQEPILLRYIEFEIDSLTSLEPESRERVVGIRGVDAELIGAPFGATHYRTYHRWVGVAPDGQTLMMSEPIDVSARRSVDLDRRFAIKPITEILSVSDFGKEEDPLIRLLKLYELPGGQRNKSEGSSEDKFRDRYSGDNWRSDEKLRFDKLPKFENRPFKRRWETEGYVLNKKI